MKKENVAIKKQVKELEDLKSLSLNDFEFEHPSKLDIKILNKYEEIWKYVLETCKKEEITREKDFNKKHTNFYRWGLNQFIEDYFTHLCYCSDYDDLYTDSEIKFLEEALNQFELDEFDKREYEIVLIRDLHFKNQKEKAKKLLTKWQKEYPDDIEGYEIQCEWEFEKHTPNYNKIGKILDEVSQKGLYGLDEDIYQNIIIHYDDLDEQDKVEHFTELYEEKIAISSKNLDFDDDDFDDDGSFLDDAIDLEYERMIEEEKQEILEDLRRIATDKVTKSKKIEQYLSEKTTMELFQILGPHAFFKDREEIAKLVNSDIKEYLLKKYLDITYNNLLYLPKNLLNELDAFPDSGLKKINFKKSNVISFNNFNNIILLKNLGVAFLELKKETLYVGIPLIKEIKEFLKDENLIKENNRICEIVDIITGMCEAYGAIKLKQVKEILKTFYPNMDHDQFTSYILLCLTLIRISSNTKDMEKKKLDYIEHLALNAESRTDILKSKKELKKYTKEEYLKFGNSNFLENTKGYQIIMSQFKYANPDIIDIKQVFAEAIFNYSIDYRLNKPNADKMLKDLLSPFEDDEFVGLFFNIDVKKIREGIKLLQKELPKWK